MGGGNVAQRRVPTLIAAGADVHVVSPGVTPAIEGLVGLAARCVWHERGFEDADLDGAWYVMAATDDAAVNERVERARRGAAHLLRARRRRRTPPPRSPRRSARHAGDTVAVMGSTAAERDPRRHASLRDDIVTALREGSLAHRGTTRDHGPGRRPRRAAARATPS